MKLKIEIVDDRSSHHGRVIADFVASRRNRSRFIKRLVEAGESAGEVWAILTCGGLEWAIECHSYPAYRVAAGAFIDEVLNEIQQIE